MNWFLIALLAEFIWCVVIFTDKYLVGSYYRKVRPGTLMFLTAFASLVFSASILIIRPESVHIPLDSALIVMLAGALYFIASFPYLMALKKDEASSSMPIFQVIPFISYVLGFIFLHERLSTQQLLAGIIILVGAVIISLDQDSGFKIKKSVLWLMILSSFFYAMEFFLFKFVAIDTGFWTAAFYQYSGTGLAGVLLIILSANYRNDFKKVLSKSFKQVVSISLFIESLDVVARVLFNYASLLAPLALVSLVGGFQPAILLGMGVLITLLFPRFGQESLLRRHIMQKLCAILIIFCGTFLLFN